MTLKDFFDVCEIKSWFTLDLGNGDEILISEEDTALINAFGNIVIDRVFLPSWDCKVYAKTALVREG